jgi:hypothetical protein
MGWTILELDDRHITMRDASIVLVAFLTIDFARRHPDDFPAATHPCLEDWWNHLCSCAVGAFDLELHAHLVDEPSRRQFASLLRAARTDLERFGPHIAGEHLQAIVNDPTGNWRFRTLPTFVVDEAYERLLGLIEPTET